jgi:hypothetical protein
MNISPFKLFSQYFGHNDAKETNTPIMREALGSSLSTTKTNQKNLPPALCVKNKALCCVLGDNVNCL